MKTTHTTQTTKRFSITPKWVIFWILCALLGFFVGTQTAHGQTVLLKGGNQANLTTLAAREPAVTLDTLRLWIGTSGGNKDLTGSRWFYGVGVPSSILGYVSDVYLNTASGAVYQKTGAGWGTPIYTVPASNPGTVTSIALTVPSGFSVTGSPVTSSGTLAITSSLTGLIKGTGGGFASATAGTDYLAPISGSINQTLRFSGANTLAASSILTNDGNAIGLRGIGVLSDGGADRIRGTGQLILEQTGDSYGTTRLYLRNRNGAAGAIFENAGLPLVDFIFQHNAGQRNIRLDARTAYTYTGAANEWQIGNPADPPAGATESTNPHTVFSSAGLYQKFGYIRADGGYKSSDGTAGASATTGGATFKNGLYTSGTISSGGGGASGGPGFRVSRAAGYQTLYAANTFHPDAGLVDSDDATAYALTGSGSTGSAVTALYDLRASVDQTPLAVASVAARIGYKRSPSVAIEYSSDGTTWTVAPTLSSPSLSIHTGTYSLENYNITLSAPTAARYWRLSVADAGISAQGTQAAIANFAIVDADGNAIQ